MLGGTPDFFKNQNDRKGCKRDYSDAQGHLFLRLGAIGDKRLGDPPLERQGLRVPYRPLNFDVCENSLSCRIVHLTRTDNMVLTRACSKISKKSKYFPLLVTLRPLASNSLSSWRLFSNSLLGSPVQQLQKSSPFEAIWRQVEYGRKMIGYKPHALKKQMAESEDGVGVFVFSTSN